MTAESESNRPNGSGFAGGATAPQPEPAREPDEQVDGESIAIPSDDLTAAISGALEEAIRPDEDDDAGR